MEVNGGQSLNIKNTYGFNSIDSWCKYMRQCEFIVKKKHTFFCVKLCAVLQWQRNAINIKTLNACNKTMI